MRIFYQQDGGGGGGGSPEWFEALPEPIREWDEVKNSDGPDKFWDQMSNMRSLIGRSIQIPGENASADDHKAFNEKLMSKVSGLIRTPDKDNEESVNQFYTALGRPESHEKYTNPEMDTKGVDVDDSPLEAFKPIAHKHGLTQEQFSGIVSDMTAINVEKAIQDNMKTQEAQTALKNEWGMAYDVNMSKIRNVAANTGAPKGLVDAITAGVIDSSTAKWLLDLGSRFKGEGVNLNKDRSSDGVLSPKQAQKEITDIMNNKDHAYWHPEQAGHQEAKEYMRKLYEMSEPDSQQATIGTGQGGTAGVGGIRFG